MKTILAPTDYSETAGNAVDFAASLARHFGARLLLFHAFRLPIPTSIYAVPVPDLHQLIKENKVKLEQIAHEVARHHKIEVECTNSISFETEKFKKLVFLKKADLVVMSLEGGSPSGELFGHFTTSLLQETNFPVLVIPQGAKFRGFRKILFACAPHKLTLSTDLRLLKEIAFGFDSRIQVLQVIKEEKEPADPFGYGRKEPLVVPNLEAILRGMRHTYRQIDNHSIADGIEQGILEYEADLLVMVPHKAGLWDILLQRSKTRSMAYRTEIPLLALPPDHAYTPA